MIEAAGPSPAIARCLEWWALPRFRRLRALRLRGFAASAASRLLPGPAASRLRGFRGFSGALRLRGFAASAASRLLRGAAASRLPRLRGFSRALRLRGFRGFRGFAASPGRRGFAASQLLRLLLGLAASRLRGFVASPRWPGPVYPCIGTFEQAPFDNQSATTSDRKTDRVILESEVIVILE